MPSIKQIFIITSTSTSLYVSQLGGRWFGQPRAYEQPWVPRVNIAQWAELFEGSKSKTGAGRTTGMFYQPVEHEIHLLN